MSLAKRLLLVVVIGGLAGSVGAGVNEWTTTGPTGGGLSTAIIDPQVPSTVYVSTVAGVFKSMDSGSTWEPSRDGLTSWKVGALVMDPSDPSVLYAGTAEQGVFKSTDSGASWASVGSGAYGLNGVGPLVIHPSDASILYAGNNDGVYRSTDSATSWTLLTDGIETSAILSLAIDPVAPSTVYAGSQAGIWKSEDGGGSWLLVFELVNDGGAFSLAIDPVTPSIVYAGLGVGMLKSTDAGVTWARSDDGITGFGTFGLVVDPVTPSTLYAGTFDFGGRIFKSIDSGASWLPAEPFQFQIGVVDIVIDPSDSSTLYACRGYAKGISKSVDAGATWVAHNQGLVATEVRALAVSGSDPAVLYAATDWNSVIRSVDGGASWGPANTGLENTGGGLDSGELAVDPQHPETLYMASYPRGLFKTVDGGDQWAFLPGSPPAYAVAVDPNDPQTVYTAGDLTISRSLDGGATWEVRGGNAFRPQDLVIDPVNPSTLYVAYSSGVTKSMDAGATWVDATQGLPVARPVRSLAIDPMNPNVLYAGTFNSGVYKSLDGGASWSARNEGLPFPDIAVIRIDPQRPSTVYTAAFREGGVYVSRDGGEHWIPLTPQLDSEGVRDLAIDPNNGRRLIVATVNSGVFELTQAGTCLANANTLCLNDRTEDHRFEITLQLDSEEGGGLDDPARAIPLDTVGVEDGGLLWFFDPTNPEVLVKVLDGCAINNHYWVFYAAATTLGFDLEVRDTLFDTSRVYNSPDFRPAPTIADVQAFATCEGGQAAASRTEASSPVSSRLATRGSSSTAASPVSCVPGETSLCIDFVPGDARFEITLDYATEIGAGSEGSAHVIPLTPLGVDNGGLLWFFDAFNPEVLVKVLDGCAINGRVWVYYAAATTVGFDLTVRDTVTGEERTYNNPDQRRAITVADTDAFVVCDG